MKEVKQVIVVRKDLKLRKSELAAQVATASMGFLLDNNESERNDVINVKLSNEEALWLNGSFEKSIMGVDSEEDLKELMLKAEFEGIGVYPVRNLNNNDDILGALTCIALGPDNSEVINQVTKNLRLL